MEGQGNKVKGVPISMFKEDQEIKDIDRVEIPEGGGMFTFFKGLNIPFPGFPQHRVVKQMDFVKRFFVAQIKLTKKLLSSSWIITLGFILNTRNVLDSFWVGFKQFYPLVVRHKPDPKKFSHPVREIYRVFNLVIEREMGENYVEYEAGGVPSKHKRMLQKWEMIRDLICMMMELDNAYRWRLQDALMEMDMDKIKFDRVDEYWIAARKDYNFLGLTREERLQRLEDKNYVKQKND